LAPSWWGYPRARWQRASRSSKGNCCPHGILGRSRARRVLGRSPIWHLVKRNAQLDEKRRLHEELAARWQPGRQPGTRDPQPAERASINLERGRRIDGPPYAGGHGGAGASGGWSPLAPGERLSVYARPTSPSMEDFDGESCSDVRRSFAPTCERSAWS
jgi:hypothetical protein